MLLLMQMVLALSPFSSVKPLSIHPFARDWYHFTVEVEEHRENCGLGKEKQFQTLQRLKGTLKASFLDLFWPCQTCP